jgi:poly(ADP-ribose) glycohydrolase
MEESDGVFVDFANRQLHIGEIIPSLTQEEVLFSVAPECFVTLLFVETLADNECMLFRNVRRYSTYSGYLDTFRFTGFHNTREPMTVLAIDASMGMHFERNNLLRDLSKAYVGFRSCRPSTFISTGGFGTGAFGGDHHLKFLQQTCAATVAQCSLDYSTFKKDVLAKEFQYLLQRLHSKRISIGELVRFCATFDEDNNPWNRRFFDLLKKWLDG